MYEKAQKTVYFQYFKFQSGITPKKPTQIDDIRSWSGVQCNKQNQVPRGIQSEKSSRNMTTSRNLVSIISAQASPKKGEGTRCPEG